MTIKSPLANKFLAVAENGDAFGRKPLSKVTLRTYEHAVRRAEGLMDKPFEQWEYGDMEEFFRRAEADGFRGTTIRSMANVLRIMFRWANEAGIYNKPNPMRGMPQVVKQDDPRPALSPKEAEDVIEAIVQLLRDKREAASELAQRIPSMNESFVEKYAFIFRFSYYTGIPLKKLLLLRKDEIEDNGVYQTNIYGTRVDKVFIPVEARLMDELRQFVAEHPHTDYVFYGESGAAHDGSLNQPLGSAQAYALFADAREEVGYGKDLTPAAWATAHDRWQDHSS